MKQVETVKQVTKQLVVTKETIKCDVCEKIIPKGSMMFYGYTMDTEGPYAIDTYIDFHICSYGCLRKKIKDYVKSCSTYKFSKTKIEFTLINGG